MVSLYYQLAGLLACPIERASLAIYINAACEYEPFDIILTTGLQQIDSAGNVSIERAVRLIF